jgi:hypothetical protein
MCSEPDGTIIYAGEEEPIQVDAMAGIITVASGASDTETYGGYGCETIIATGQVNYAISGLTLTLSGGPFMNGQLTKVGD